MTWLIFSRKLLPVWCLIIFYLANVLTAFSQIDKPSFQFKRISIDQGLSGTHVTSIIQDRDGFIWIGTTTGLNRYDGYGFKQYRSNPYDSTGLQSDRIRALYEDTSGTLWVGTMRGFYFFDRAHDRFQRFLPATDSLNQSVIWAIREDSLQTLWVGTERNGLFQIDIERKNYRNFLHDPTDSTSICSNWVWGIMIDAQSDVWIGCESEQQSLQRFDRKKNQFINFYSDATQPYDLRHDYIWAFYEDVRHNFWFAAYYHGLLKTDPAGSSFKLYPIGEKDIKLR